ncbi:MAG: hypothetical protein F6J93_10495 [Oscillatoria sp. SIO1A7]|nr:hypothetical protein [Oscillatoria sp. SIO1A7]
MGFRVWGVGFRVWGLGCGVWGLGCGVWEEINNIIFSPLFPPFPLFPHSPLSLPYTPKTTPHTLFLPACSSFLYDLLLN